jgi:anthrone oxygenase-like protein
MCPQVDSINPHALTPRPLRIRPLLSTGLFAGAAVYVSFVEHPARMLCGTRLALTEFAPSYKRGAVMQVALSVLGTLAAVAAWLMGAPALWLAGGLLLGALIPFTLVVILPTNKRLLDPSLDKDSKLAKQLLHRWGRLHAFRTAASLAAFLLFLFSNFSR